MTKDVSEERLREINHAARDFLTRLAADLRSLGNRKDAEACEAIVDDILLPAYSAALRSNLKEQEPVAWLANCCNCGRVVDTREKSEGGDAYGAEASGGRWLCSMECWEVVFRDHGPYASPTSLVSRERPAVWHDIEYLMSIIDSAIEDGFDPDEDGPILDNIRDEVKAGLHRLSPTYKGEVGN